MIRHSIYSLGNIEVSSKFIDSYFWIVMNFGKLDGDQTMSFSNFSSFRTSLFIFSVCAPASILFWQPHKNHCTTLSLTLFIKILICSILRAQTQLIWNKPMVRTHDEGPESPCVMHWTRFEKVDAAVSVVSQRLFYFELMESIN